MKFKAADYSIVTGKRLTYIQFDSLKQSGLIHAFTTRIGGMDTGCLAYTNFGLNCGGAPENVKENTALLQEELDMGHMPVVRTNQKHSDHVAVIGGGEAVSSSYDPEYAVDGMITGKRGIALLSVYADCVPVYIYDNKKHIVGIIHSGWMGTAKDIVLGALEKMALEYGTSMDDITAVIGPSIGACCFEVEADVIAKLEEKHPWLSDYYTRISEIKYMADLRSVIAQSILNRGVAFENISVVDLCTKCRQDLFYSHRGSKGLTGRMAAVVALK